MNKLIRVGPKEKLTSFSPDPTKEKSVLQGGGTAGAFASWSLIGRTTVSSRILIVGRSH